MWLVISKDISNHSVVFVNKSILSETTSLHFLGFMCALLYTHSLCVYRILNWTLISHDGLWRVSVTTPLVQKMMLRLKGLPGGPLNLAHWVKVKGNASANMCKKPFSMNHTKSHALTTFPLGRQSVRISAMLFPPSCTVVPCTVIPTLSQPQAIPSLDLPSNAVVTLSTPIPQFVFQCCHGFQHFHPISQTCQLEAYGLHHTHPSGYD